MGGRVQRMVVGGPASAPAHVGILACNAGPVGFFVSRARLRPYAGNLGCLGDQKGH